ncbi:predicted protein [Lichtheimia corymbifera JMRC:FSU:9682]|uniref:Uncharacterized protein n=1 Tax=Lichtheimia corymbifera JMRC:FSU:9682 TaxID=1263082 RepID=A0A068RJI0_9FUNG|nr:predicted protein [Lichtheimia corymbifera JMRC:FSU:9682]
MPQSNETAFIPAATISNDFIVSSSEMESGCHRHAPLIGCRINGSHDYHCERLLCFNPSCPPYDCLDTIVFDRMATPWRTRSLPVAFLQHTSLLTRFPAATNRTAFIQELLLARPLLYCLEQHSLLAATCLTAFFMWTADCHCIEAALFTRSNMLTIQTNSYGYGYGYGCTGWKELDIYNEWEKGLCSHVFIINLDHYV